MQKCLVKVAIKWSFQANESFVNGCFRTMKDPWITNEILENIHDKLLLRHAKRTGKDEDWQIGRQARNRLNIDIKNVKADFINENLEQNQGETKQFWKDVQIVLPKKEKINSGNFILKDDSDVPIIGHKKNCQLYQYIFYKCWS